MEMFADWMRMKIVDLSKSDALLMLPDGYAKDPSDEDTFFEVLEIGPDVSTVAPGDIVLCSFMSGMFRFKLPSDSFKSFALRETEMIGRLQKGVAHAGDRLISS